MSQVSVDENHVLQIRRAIQAEHKLEISYVDEAQVETTRIVWPLALAFFERVELLVSWCELRGTFRHFRTDKILALKPIAEPIPDSREKLLGDWRKKEHIPVQ